MKDRFDLENEISALYNFAENLGTLSEGVLEHGLGRDEIVNAIEGLRVMLSLQANKLMDTMTQCFKLDQYRDCDYTDQDAKMDTYS
jgi:hypothetical protein